MRNAIILGVVFGLVMSLTIITREALLSRIKSKKVNKHSPLR